jgi:putative DNA-invertase from lambdoid prophage Rac
MHDSTKSVGYARISTLDQNVVNQIDKLREDGITVMFCDEGVSGMRPASERGEYRAMIKYLSTHPDVKTIVVYEISRFGRDMQNSINTFLDLEKNGYTIWSLTEAWTHQTDPAVRKFMIAVVSWLNEQELTRMRNRIHAGIDRARIHGTKSGKPIGKPAKNPDEAAVKALRDSGMSWRKIADNMGMEISTLFRYRQQWKAKALGRN